MDSNTSISPFVDNPDWGHTTLLNAKFKNNILAGNVDFTLASISGMIIKKRKMDDYKWTTIYTIPIKTEKDFDFYYNDIVVASNTMYEYAAVPIINGVEGSYQTINVDVEFEGCFIVDTTNAYQILLDLNSNNLTRSINGSVIEPFNSKYPYVYYYSQLQYDKFSVSGAFIELNQADCTWDIENSGKYRKSLRDFISNQRAKLVKFFDGRIYLACAIDSVTESGDSHPYLVHSTINFIEIGDVNSNSDLYYHGFTEYLEGVD